MRKLGWLALVASFATACDDGTSTRENTDSAVDGGADPSADAGAGAPSEVTYWQHMVPLFEQHCLQCHQEGGIGPVRLDLYAEAKEFAALIGDSTMERRMPPWHATSDGSCGDFRGSLALDDAQIALIAAWVEGGAKEGKAGRVNLPAPDRLQDASDYALPSYAPVVQGGMLAENDDYHCFLLDANLAAERFITGYDIVPGRPEIVHHVLVMVVDPDAPADLTEAPEDLMLPAGTTNAQVMAALDAESPDKPGWPCWGQAGDGVFVRSTPAVWAPGQGVMRFPGDSGASLRPTDKLVVQVHYNLADPELRGKTDETHVLLELAQHVPNLALFAVPDALLESLFDRRARHAGARQGVGALLVRANGAGAGPRGQHRRRPGRIAAGRAQALGCDAAHARARAQVPDARAVERCFGPDLRSGRAELGLPLATHVLLREALGAERGLPVRDYLRLRHQQRAGARDARLGNQQRNVPRHAVLHGARALKPVRTRLARPKGRYLHRPR